MSQLVNESMNDNFFCRSAPATPVLLIIKVEKQWLSQKQLKTDMFCFLTEENLNLSALENIFF